MPLPWEEFGGSTATEEEGPWKEFAPSAPSEPWKEFEGVATEEAAATGPTPVQMDDFVNSTTPPSGDFSLDEPQKKLEELGPFETVGGVGKAEYERAKKAGFETGSVTDAAMQPAFEVMERKKGGAALIPALEMLAPPLIPLLEGAKALGAKPEAPELAERAAAIGQNVVADTANFFTSPVGIGTLGLASAPVVVQKLVAGLFAAHTASGAPDTVRAIAEAKTPEERDAAITSAIEQAMVIAGGAAHATGRAPIAAPERLASMEAARERIAGAAPGATPPIPEPAPSAAAPAPLAEPAAAIREPAAGEALTAEANRTATPAERIAQTESQTLPEQSGVQGPRETLAENAKSAGWKQSALPEELRTSPELEAALSGPKEPAARAPMLEKAFAEGGEIGGAGGGKPVVKPAGVTPKGDTAFIRVESAPKRLFKGLLTEGAADVMEKSKNTVGKTLAKQMRKHVDVEQELTGQLTAELDRATKGMSKSGVESAIAELEPYLAAKENGRPLPTISKGAQSMLTAWENIAERTGLMSEAHDVQVFDPTTGSHRSMHRIGRSYVPRVFKPEVQKVLSDPRTNPKLFNDLAADLAAHRGVTLEAAAAELRGVAGRFQSSDFMGNMEMARTGQLPEAFYDYNLGNVAARYIPSFSERMAQIIAYGQRLGPREAPLRENLWDVAMKEAEDSYTQHWLRAAEDQSANLKATGGFGKIAQQGQTLASGLLLSSPTTTVMRNMLSGTAATTELVGVRRSAENLVKAATDAQTKLDAREIGAVRENLGDFLHADQLGNTKGDELIRGVVNKMLKYSTYNASEGFVRTHAAATASQFAKDGVKAIAKDPSSGAAKEALGLFKRLGVDAEKVVAEGGDWKTGAETRKFVRTLIRDTQGGYRFDQVPLWANSPVGRFFFQYLRWGTQRSRNIWKNGIQPLIGEEVQWHGKTMARRDAGPIIKMGLGAIALGEAYALVSQGFFARDRKDATVQEITEALTEDQKNAAVMMADRVINDIIMSGSLGIWTQPVDALKGMRDQSRLKNPAEPPAMATTKAVSQLAKNAFDQEGRVTNKDLLQFVGGVVPGVKQLTDFGRNIFDEPLYEAENDVRTLRGAATRWATANKIDVPKRSVSDIRKSANSPEYEAIHDALLVGDADRAKVLASKFTAGEKDKTKANAAVKNSIKARQPFRVGPFTNGEYRTEFMTWAASHLPKKDFEQAKRVQDRYEAAAKAASLW